jgi:DNA-binding PadR family transcriptional regulator
MEKHDEVENERKKALDEQIKAILEKQKEEERGRKKSVREEITARMAAARDLAREEHIKKYHADYRQKPLELQQDQGDVEVRKGFLKLHILSVLKEGPSHGYEIMHRIGQHTGHIWRPSPGSMYPALESLEVKGFIACKGDGRRKVYSLTTKGEEAIGQVRKKRQEQFLEIKAFLSDIFGE